MPLSDDLTHLPSREEPDESPSEDLSATPAELRFGGSWKMVIPFAVLPLLIVSASVAIFFLFGKLAQNQLGPHDYLQELKSASGHKRWQAAFELSGYLARQDIGAEKKEFEREILSLLKSSRGEEATFRRYLLVALAQVGSEASLPALIEIVRETPESETRIYGLLALARIGSPEAAQIVADELKSEDAGIRKTAAFALGFVGNSRDIPKLENLLEDSTVDVRWNAALGLARLGSPSGSHELLRLIDVEQLRQETPNLRESERNEIMLSAVNAIGRLKLKSAREKVSELAKVSADTRLRTAARQVEELLANNL